MIVSKPLVLPPRWGKVRMGVMNYKTHLPADRQGDGYVIILWGPGVGDGSLIAFLIGQNIKMKGGEVF